MSGFGHRVHSKDPRTVRLFELAREAGVGGVHRQAARAVEKAFADAKKSLPINVDGAIGAILADLGMTPAAFNGIFMHQPLHCSDRHGLLAYQPICAKWHLAHAHRQVQFRRRRCFSNTYSNLIRYADGNSG